MINMKRLLFISSRPIYPIIGGDQIRTAQQLEFLCTKYKVDVIYQTEVQSKMLICKYLPVVSVEKCFRSSKWMNYMRTLYFLCNHLPLQVNYYYDKEMKRYIDLHLSEYDIVFCNNIRTAEYVRRASNIVKVIDFVDAISMNYEKAKSKAKGLKRLIYEIDYRRCRRYERQVLKDFDRCATISEIDRQYILKWQ